MTIPLRGFKGRLLCCRAKRFHISRLHYFAQNYLMRTFYTEFLMAANWTKCYEKQTIILVFWTSKRMLMTEGEHKVNLESEELSVRIIE